MTPTLPTYIPIFPLEGALLLPRTQMPLNIFEPRYLTMVEDALGKGRLFGMIQPREESDGPTPDEIPIYNVGCMGRIVEFREMDDGRFLIGIEGVCRFRVVSEQLDPRGYRMAEVSFDDFRHDLGEDKSEVDRAALFEGLHRFLDLAAEEGTEAMEVNWEALKQAPDEDLINALSMLGPFEPREKQALLEAELLSHRAEMLITMMSMAYMGTDDGTSGTA